MCIYLYKRAKQTMCLCVCAVAIITKVATRCTLGILKSLISVQQSALLVAPPLHIHTHTHAPTLQPDNFAAYFPMLGRKLFAGKNVVRLRPLHPLQTKPPAVPAHCSYITKHLCVRNALFILVAPGSFCLLRRLPVSLAA